MGISRPTRRGGCWKELPRPKKKAIWNPQNEDHRCFMWCVLPLPGLKALADADFSGLPTEPRELRRHRGFDGVSGTPCCFSA